MLLMKCNLLIWRFRINFSEDFKVLRQQIIDMIMATEMKQHFEHLSKFDNSLNNRTLSHEDTGSMVCSTCLVIPLVSNTVFPR